MEDTFKAITLGLAIGIEAAAALLKTVELRSWIAIGLFAAVLALRTFVKRALLWDEARLRRLTLTSDR